MRCNAIHLAFAAAAVAIGGCYASHERGAAQDAAGVDLGAAADVGAVCHDNAECGGFAWCAGTGCGTPGHCEPAPASIPAGFCDQPPMPVCGCDGRTYTNPCRAQVARVRVASDGACPGTVDAGP